LRHSSFQEQLIKLVQDIPAEVLRTIGFAWEDLEAWIKKTLLQRGETNVFLV